MSGGLDLLSLKSEDMLKFLAVNAHTGSENMDYQMEQYIFKRTPSGTHIINLRKTWEKLLLAARAIVSITNPADVFVISSYVKCQRAILKFASHTGATPIAGRFTPGTFTNQIQKNFKEPLLLIVADPLVDHQPIMEAACVNIPVIAFCNAESPLRYVDIAIPCNNKGVHCIGLMFWMLAREILRFRGTIPREKAWEVMPDLYFYREPEETEKEGALEGEKAITEDPNAMAKVSDSALLQTQWASGGGFGDMGLGQPPMPHSPIKHQDMDSWGQDTIAPMPAPHYAVQPNIIQSGIGSYGLPMGAGAIPNMASQAHIPPTMGPGPAMRTMGASMGLPQQQPADWDSMQQATPVPVAPVVNKDWQPAVTEWGADGGWN